MNKISPNQRGTKFGYKILAFMYHIFGYRFLSFFLFFVVFYYYITAWDIRSITKKYYEKAGLDYGESIFFRHLYSFAIATLDRFVSSFNPELFKIKSINSESIRYEEKGSILLMSHFGAWGIASNLLSFDECKINIVMKEAYSQDIKKIEADHGKKHLKSVQVIDLNNGFSAIVAIASALKNCEIVSMMVDRVYDDNNTIRTRLFGKNILLNKSPFELALKLQVPIYTMFVIGGQKNGYQFVFSNKFSGSNMQELVDEYALNLEKAILENPLLWFNFYDFWISE